MAAVEDAAVRKQEEVARQQAAEQAKKAEAAGAAAAAEASAAEVDRAPDGYLELMGNLWDHIPSDRPTFEEAHARLEEMLEHMATTSCADLGLGVATVGQQLQKMMGRLAALEAQEREHSKAKRYLAAAKTQREIDGMRKLVRGATAAQASLFRGIQNM